ncbi:hypothetical protein B0J13DRAFT_560256 [Dactylonectria estremocensis]|uniref:Zn(2)-C6 fungal-type domain-containing protein n=1 Tax=Dactylonectria estremocensis TaxID=1079267 RepID=A0A9P9EGX6_9HYPO|nr:hypothetical protein B0J13DRAFT_560256 [Dactylonectria estremocensis]
MEGTESTDTITAQLNSPLYQHAESEHVDPSTQSNGARRDPTLRGRGHKATAAQGRKPKACLECKKLKIRCDFFPGDRKCRYCLRRNVDCIINRTYMARVQDTQLKDGPVLVDHDKIDAMYQDIQDVKHALDALLNKHSVQEPQVAAAGAQALLVANKQHTPLSSALLDNTTPSSAAWSSAREDNTHMAMTRENSLEPAQGGDGNEPVTLEEPMGSLYEVTKLRNIRSNKAKTARPSPENIGEVHDFISRGIISEHEAEELYDVFVKTLNHYLWVGLEQIHTSFISVRQSSELLTATILTVTALHLPNSAATFDACYKEFLSLISSSMFSRYHSIDDVRGLCISAFWLSEVSWKLSGHAIRIATELNVHQSFTRALKGDKEHFLRARLWYILYVCDHHFSIAYGRPPMTSESIQIREHELFLASPLAEILDARILSQVHLMQILTRLYHRFSEYPLPEVNDVSSGAPSGRGSYAPVASHSTAKESEFAAAMLAESDLEIISAYNLEIDQWRMRWYPRQPSSPFIGNFPHRGVVLYSYFAKLQINSLAVRGVSVSSGRLSTERKEFANMAVSAAVSILTLVLEEDDMRKALVGTPLYVHTMIAFASVFLMKATTKWDRLMGLNIEYTFVSRLLGRMVVLLKSAVTSDRHMIRHVALGLEKMLGRLAVAKEEEMANHSSRFGLESHSSPAIALAPQSQLGSVDKSWTELRGEPGLQLPTTSEAQSSGAQIDHVQGWVPDTYHQSGQNMGLAGDGSTVLDDNLLYQAFGTGSANDVYNLLASHFQY